MEKSAVGLFDLQLSGHAHKGQIFPWTLLVRLVHPQLAGLYTLPSGSSLYVSRGSGTWGPPIRFLAPPEVTVIDLVPEPPCERNGTIIQTGGAPVPSGKWPVSH
ncbi:MAG: hypothetical protein MZU91_00040 [Desulfosudis oleivorans]|nr:hypothetical protein [Desulfosudis oleivorans]